VPFVAAFVTSLLDADAGFAGVGRCRRDRKQHPIDIIMACEAGRISIGLESSPWILDPRSC
jgi:hypothetical protein